MPEEDQGRWQKFVAETLSELNERNSRELGGHNPMHFSSDEDNDDFRDVPFTTDSSLQQVLFEFSQYSWFGYAFAKDSDDCWPVT